MRFVLSNDLDAGKPRRLLNKAGLASAALAGVALLVWFGWTGMGTRNEMRLASQRAVRVAELRGTIASLGEWLTMSAELVAWSGDRRWIERYGETSVKLDAAIAEARDLSTPDVRAALTATTDEAHRDLVAMERRALDLATAGDLAAARALLSGPEFGYLKDVYAGGLEAFGQSLKTVADARAADLDKRAWMETGRLGLLAVLLVAGALALRGHLRLRAAMARTAAVAGTDLLTDLPNRRQFCQEIEAALASGRRTGLDHALLLIDLDRFKAVNDAHGHPAGDELLRLVGQRLRTLLQDETRIARLGGDEFAFLLRCDPAGPDQPQADPAAVAARIVGELAKPFELTGGVVAQIGASVGIGLTRAGDAGIGDLMHRADVGLYRAKAEGRSCFRFFEQGTDVRVRALALLESEFRQAVADDAIVPHFQPLVDIDTGRLVGAEMLARWPHPTRGMVSPAEFIPIAEDTGLIGPMTVGLLRQGCRAAANWPPNVTLACNVSPLQLRDPGLPGIIAAVLAETGFPAHRLEVEVTESALMGDLALARALLNEIKALGVRLALDDFGTGYSCLRHLQQLPFDTLKIDASFVGAMVTDEESAKIVSAVVGLGRSLGMTTVAEGIEAKDTAALLRDLGCDIGQGWLFGRPVPAEVLQASMDRDVASSVPSRAHAA